MLAFDDFIRNNYFNSYFVEYKLQDLFKDGEPEKAFETILKVYQKLDFDTLSEAQLEEEFIKPVLQELGYFFAYQVSKKAFGKNYKPDFALFESEMVKNEHYKNQDSNKTILGLCESKGSKVELDNLKNTEENPHFQLIRYLNDLKINFGFLTNGRFWRFYNVEVQTKGKVFYEINLEIILQKADFEAFQFFYYIFRKEYLQSLVRPQTDKPIKDFFEASQEYVREVENDLKELIYGDDSIIEMIGQNLFAKYHPQYSLREIYANSLFFAFRMLFIAYFESKFQEELFKIHPIYKYNSLDTILRKFESKIYKPDFFNAWNDLKILFRNLDKGNIDLEIPLLNGGLFAEEKAILLTKPQILDNQTLHKILSLLLLHRGLFTAKRDFKTLSVGHIGNIYEGLLESEFRKAHEGVFYLEYLEGKTFVEGYFDEFDCQRLEKDHKKIRILKKRFYEPTKIYFTNRSNTRKTTASYYTPPDITNFMAKESIEKLLSQKESILDLRIMDNACGSGHFLLECMTVLTEKALWRLMDKTDPKLQQALQTEKEIIEQELAKIAGGKFELDELTLLKRILLKKIIFGVDLNDFAIELTRLSLWLDTFILGTPLSFIEHHVKTGNTLIGFTKAELFENLKEKQDLFADKLKDKIRALIEKLSVLSNLKDSTPQEIAESKRVYESLQPELRQLNLVMNFFIYQRFVPIMFRQEKEVLKAKQKELQTALDTFEKEIFEEKNAELVQNIQETAQKFSFFNYEIEFAECFQNGNSGFDLIIGNPPWDKTKFDDKDFFPMWRSSYRTMKQSEKEETRITILNYKGVQDEYDHKRNFIGFANEYYKAHFPHNAGAGDNNLFRFFIERNLALLCKTGVMTYITPSAWIYEDSSLNIRKHIFTNYHLHYFYQFENRKGIFPAVHRSYKFAIFQLTHKTATPPLNPLPFKGEGAGGGVLPVRFMKTDTNVLYENKGQNEILHYPYEDIYTLSPNHWALFEVKSDQDLAIIRKAYQKFQPLNPDYLDFRNELHLTADRDIFKEKPDDMFLYEGKMIHQFRNGFAEPQYWINRKDYEKRFLETEISRLISDIYEQLPEKDDTANRKNQVLKYLDLSEENLLDLIVFDTEFPRLVFRDVASNTNERSIISAFLPPKHTYGNTLQGSIPKKYILNKKQIEIKAIPLDRLLFVNSILNSIVVDYLIRFIIDMHVNKTYLMRLPIPQPSDEELQENEVYKKLIINALKLNLYYSKNPQGFENLAGLGANFEKIELPKTEKQAIFVQIENDVLIGKLYGLDLEEMKHLSSPDYFKVLNEKQPEYLAELYRKYSQNA